MKLQTQTAASAQPEQPVHKRFTVPLWALALIQTFTAWQMGVVYYSSETFTLNGVTPLPVSVGSATLAIVLGYLCGAALAWFFPRRVGLWGKVLTVVSFVLICLMFTPLPQAVLAALYHLSAFTCVCFISVATVLAVNAYSLKTALLDGVVGTMVSAPLVALLHFQPFMLDFRLFNLFSVLVQLLILVGLSRIPGRIDMAFISPRRSAAPEEKTQPPKALLRGSFFVFVIACLCVLFSSTTAESIRGGISLYYLCSGVWAALYAWLHYRKGVNPYVLYTIFLGVAALGFILWLLPFSAVKPVSLALQGAGLGLCNLVWFIAGTLFERWQSRLIAPACILISLAAALLHAVLLEALRDNAAILYAVYAGTMLVLLVVYFLTEPYFRRVWLDAYVGEQSPGPGAAAGRQPPQAGERQSPPPASPALPKPLTRRELEVAGLAVQGYENAAIARLLFISENTVKTHMKSIFQKMEVHSRFELAAKWNRRNAVSPEGADTHGER